MISTVTLCEKVYLVVGLDMALGDLEEQMLELRN